MDVVQPLAAIVFVMALLGGALLMLRKRGAVSFRLPGTTGSVPRRLEVVERLSLGAHHSLHLVRADGRVLLIATAPNSCQFFDHAASNESKA
jgi:flagellar biogenesis protein FliO